jgi:hypothetical protein
MTTNRSTRVDRFLPELLEELADARTPAYLEAAIERASSRPQRPAWTFPRRWLPVQIATEAFPTPRGLTGRLLVLVLVGLLIALATVAVYVGSQQRQVPNAFGPAANGLIALEKDGDIFVADRPGGDLRPLLAGPENERLLMFSPDGTKLAFLGEDPQLPTALMVADADGTNVVQVATEPPGMLSFAPDGRSLMGVARIDGEHRIVLIPVEPGAASTVLDIRLPRSGMELSWSGGPKFNPRNPEEILVVVQPEPGGPHVLSVYDLATSSIRSIVEPAEDRFPEDVAWLPDGEHIIYDAGLFPRIVAADGSGDRALDAIRDRISPPSNGGTRIVLDVAEVDLPGDDSHQGSVVVPIEGEGKRVELACGLGTGVDCAWSWIWSPDDSMLVGTVPHETSSTYLLADPDTGQVTDLGWDDVGAWAWQRVAP